MLSYGSESTSCGIDVNIRAVQHCRTLGLKAFHVTPTSTFPFSDSAFPVVICDQVLEHISDPTHLLSEASRVLQPGGFFLVGLPCLKGYLSDPDHKKYYTKNSLIPLFQTYGFSLSRDFLFPFPLPFLGRLFSFQYHYYIFTQS